MGRLRPRPGKGGRDPQEGCRGDFGVRQARAGQVRAQSGPKFPPQRRRLGFQPGHVLLECSPCHISPARHAQAGNPDGGVAAGAGGSNSGKDQTKQSTIYREPDRTLHK